VLGGLWRLSEPGRPDIEAKIDRMPKADRLHTNSPEYPYSGRLFDHGNSECKHSKTSPADRIETITALNSRLMTGPSPYISAERLAERTGII
jgi:hypothetical protein